MSLRGEHRTVHYKFCVAYLSWFQWDDNFFVSSLRHTKKKEILVNILGECNTMTGPTLNHK